ncbi:MAG: transporter [Candidatus Omnitrophica bacterium]|nr:transporter [Candidatus Omnitrophota bacterium]
MFFYRKLPLLSLVIMMGLSSQAMAGDVHTHAPIGVMGDHRHKSGEWMVSYRYMRMDMSQHYAGSSEISVEEVHDDFMISPVDMQMDMHMLGGMYGLSDDVTLMLMVPYLVKDMEHRRRTDSRQFSAASKGVGDISVSGIFSLEQLTEIPVHFNLGVSLPSGSINRKDDTLAGADQVLPYPMQLGSGTHDLRPGLTYFDHNDSWSWGAQLSSIIRTGKNTFKYRLGDRYGLTAWTSYKWSDALSSSLRIEGSKWGNITGADPRLNINMTPTANPGLQAGERIDVFVGLNYMQHEGWLKDHRLALEFGFPVYQHLSGPQLAVGLQGTIGWQKAF